MMSLTSMPWVVALGPVVLTLWRVNGGTVMSPRLDKLLERVELAATIGLVVGLVALAGRGVVNPAAWDFPAFYTVGSQAAEGGSVYDPAELATSFERWRHGVGVDGDWLDEIGYWYAPPTTFLLAPLGFFGFRTALTLHHVVQFAFLAGVTWRLHNVVPLGRRRLDVARMVVLVVAFRPVGSAVLLGQIVFGALFFEAWAYSRAAQDESVGWLLGIGALFKHLLIIPAVLLALVGRWRLLGATVLSLAATCAAAALVFGPSAFVEFIEFGPAERDPEIAIYGVVQSLNAELRRWFQDVPASPGAAAAILYVPYLLAAGAATAVTLLAMARARRQQCGAIVQLALAATLALLVYPNTLFNTLPLLLPVVFVLLSPATGFHNRSTRDRRLIVGLVGFGYALPALLFAGGFYTMVLLWSMLVILSLTGQWPTDPIEPGADPDQQQQPPVRVILPSGAVKVLTWPTATGTVSRSGWRQPAG